MTTEMKRFSWLDAGHGIFWRRQDCDVRLIRRPVAVHFRPRGALVGGDKHLNSGGQAVIDNVKKPDTQG
jgi:hypothetical protein